MKKFKLFKLEEKGEKLWDLFQSEIYQIVMNNGSKYYLRTGLNFSEDDYFKKINIVDNKEFIYALKIKKFQKLAEVILIDKSSITTINPIGFGICGCCLKTQLKFIKWYKKNYEYGILLKDGCSKFVPMPIGRPLKIRKKKIKKSKIKRNAS